MVNWKAADATDRLFASLIAANSGLKLDYHSMAAIYGQGATYDAIESRFRRYRKMADELRTEAQARGVNVDGSVPRTPRGPQSKAPGSASASASKSKTNPSSAAKNKKGFENSTVPETPTKANGSIGNTLGTNAADVIFLDDSSASPELQTMTRAESPFVKSEYVKQEPAIRRSPTLPIPSRATPSPRVKPENLIAGSVTPLKRSVEDMAESPTLPVKAGRREVTNPFVLGMGDSFAMSDPFVNEDYYEGAA